MLSLHTSEVCVKLLYILHLKLFMTLIRSPLDLLPLPVDEKAIFDYAIA